MAHGRRWLIGAALVVTSAMALVLVAFGGQPSLAEGGVIYVDASTDPGGDGVSWGTAFADLQDALDAAAAVAPVEIWVAAGTYKPTSGTDRAASFQMANGVAIYGGFDPSVGATDLEDRDWVLHESILSGDIGTEGDPDDNSYHVFYHPDGTGLDATAILDGFTITGGNADGDDWPQHDAGGGMFNYASSPALSNVTFDGNTASAGGGMHNSWASLPTLTNCTFLRNTAVDEGGGMLNDTSSPILTGCTFSGNSADAGGGIHNISSSPALNNVTFAGNQANSGGGIHNNESSPVLVNCTFWGNSAHGKGGGIRNKTYSAPTLTNCTFYDNTATDGGAIQNFESSSPTLTNCILWGDSHPEIDNSDNSAASVTFSDVEGSSPDPVTGNINEDPLFQDPENGDFHLGPGSPCIDAGTNEASDLPEFDFEGDPRSLDGDRDGTATVDMGVDEALWHRVHLPLVLRGY